MRQIIKLVASVLLLALPVVPMFAVSSCQEFAQFPICCGIRCSMIISGMGAGATGKIGVAAAKPACCKLWPHSTVSVTAQRAPETPMDIAAQPDGLGGALASSSGSRGAGPG